MVSKKEKMAQAEACIEELARIMPSQGALDENALSPEKKEHFFALASKYASFKEDPTVKEQIAKLEDKYGISQDFRTRVEEYAQRRAEVLEKKKTKDFVERTQMILENQEEDRANAEDVLTDDQFRDLLQKVDADLRDLKKMSKEREKHVKRFCKEMIKRPETIDPLVFVAMTHEKGKEFIEDVIQELPDEVKTKAQKSLDFHVKLKKAKPEIYQIGENEKSKLLPAVTGSRGRRLELPSREEQSALVAGILLQQHIYERRIATNACFERMIYGLESLPPEEKSYREREILGQVMVATSMGYGVHLSPQIQEWVNSKNNQPGFIKSAQEISGVIINTEQTSNQKTGKGESEVNPTLSDVATNITNPPREDFLSKIARNLQDAPEELQFQITKDQNVK